jgi:hypothetical protein
LSPEERSTAVRAAKSMGLNVCGVDMLRANHGAGGDGGELLPGARRAWKRPPVWISRARSSRSSRSTPSPARRGPRARDDGAPALRDRREGSRPAPARTVDLPVSALSDHTPVTMSAHVIHGKPEGPTLFVSAGVHGDEVIGIEIVRRLLKAPALRPERDADRRADREFLRLHQQAPATCRTVGT